MPIKYVFSMKHNGDVNKNQPYWGIKRELQNVLDLISDQFGLGH